MKRHLLCIASVLFAITASVSGQSRGFVANSGQIEDQDGKPNLKVRYQYASAGANISLVPGGFEYHLYEAVFEKDFKMPGFSDPEKKQPAPPQMSYHRIEAQFINSNPAARYIPQDAIPVWYNYYTGNTPESGVTVHSTKKVLLQNIYNGIDILFSADNGFKYDIIVHPGGRLQDVELRYSGADGLKIAANGALILQNSIREISETIPASFLIHPEQKTQTPAEVSYHLNPQTNTVTFATTPYDPSMELVVDPWATYYGGNDIEYGERVGLDPAGNVYFSGLTLSIASIATTGAYQTTRGGDWDAFVAKFSKSGSIIWGTYFGGSTLEYNYSLGVDSTGKRVAICGHTQSTSAIASSGAHQTSLSGTGTWDAFIAVFNDSGKRQWSTYLGGTSNDYGNSLCFDGAGNVIASGYTSSSSGFPTSGAHQSTNAGSFDMFLSKFNSSGVLQWGTFIGGTQTEIVLNSVCDYNRDILLVGYSASSTGIATSGVHQSGIAGSGSTDAILIKFNTNGQRLWGTYYGGTGGEMGLGISLDKKSNILLCGSTGSTSNIATNGSHQILTGGSNDAFLVKFNKNGTRQWGTYYGGSSNEEFYGTGADSAGNVYAGGMSYSTSGIATTGAYQTTNAGAEDGVIVKFTDSGKRVWATYFGGTSTDRIYGMDVNPNGDVLIGGYTGSNSGIATTGAHQTTKGVGEDGFLALFNGKGSLNSLDNNTISGNTEVCYNQSPGKLTGSTPTGGTGSYTYKWMVSTTSATSGFSTASGTSNQSDYTPGALTQTTWYKRVVTSGSQNDTSSALRISIQTVSAGFSINDTSQCEGANQFVFTNSSTTNTGGIKIYNWKFGTDTSTAKSPVKSFTTVGKTSVKLLVVSSGNCKDSVTKNIYIDPDPQASFKINNNTQCLPGNQFNFTGTSTLSTGTIMQTQWDFGDGSTQSVANPAKSYANAGSFSVSLVVTSDKGCTDTARNSVTVKKNATADFTINSDAQCLAQNNFIFTDASKNNGETISLRTWHTGDGNQSNSQNPSYSYSAPGNYKVKLIVRTSYGCQDSLVKNVNVYAMPTVKPRVNEKTQCFTNHQFEFTDSSTVQNGTLFKRTWYVDDGTKSTFLKWNKSFTSVGIHKVKLVVESNYGCSDSGELQIRAVPDAIAKIGLTAVNTCLGNNLFQLADNSTITGGSIAKRRWDFGDGTSATQKNTSKTYGNAGTYTARLVVESDQGCKDSAEEEITVYPGPTVGNISGLFQNLNAGTPYFYIITSQPNTTYTWKTINGTLLSGQGTSTASISWTAMGAGSVSVVASQSNGCKDSTQKLVEITGMSGIKSTGKHSTEIYPNPADDFIYINPSNAELMLVYSSGGQLIYRGNPLKIYNTRDIRDGVYQLILMYNSGKTESGKFIVSHHK
ncbi:MAG: PKD domain-containing protein [Bacteroidetes bacterium]|nr:PKD domain-containing protein [Bacteroidota bacterium]